MVQAMKPLLVFMGMLLICSAFVFYQSDMGRYIRAQTEMKALAEECAAGAALYYEEAAYAGGEMVFNREEGRRHIEHLLGSAAAGADFEAAGPVSYTVAFYDDHSDPADRPAGFTAHPSVVVRLSVATKDIFRLPFLSVTRLERAAMYELPAS
jgi:hypothetical protein